MKLTERDKKLAMIVPTAIVLLVYGFLFLRPKAAEKARVEKTHADAVAKAPSQTQIAAVLTERAQQSQETQAMRARLEAVQKNWGYETAFCTTGPDRHERVEKLTNLLSSYHISAIEDADVDAAGKETKVSPSHESMLKKIAQLSAAQRPQMRRIRFHGRYVDVKNILDSLSGGEVVAIPVGLTMKTIDSTDGRREWTLLVWL